MKIKVNGTSISASERCSLTEGNINSLYVDFEFYPEWENLIKTAVFANGTASISIPITASRHAIPWEVLAHTGELYVSLRGSTDGGNVVRTTGNAFLGRVQSSLAAVIGEATPNVIDILMAEVANHEERITELEEHGSGDSHPYTSLARKGSYLYDVTFADIPAFAGGDGGVVGGCSSFVKDGKLFRNMDWDYSELASFRVIAPGFEGMAFTPGLTDTELDDDLIGQLPYRLVDGCNDYGIRVSTHVLFNDWSWIGSGDTPLYKLPYIILSSIKTLDNLSTQLADVLGDLYATPTLTAADYMLQFLVTDGSRTYAILPPESASGAYTVVDITANPKLANFRWVNAATVQRADLQTHPTGVERWNMMPCELSDLRFTKCYEAPDRLSEFIGIGGTDKDSTDAELEEIYNTAHELYLTRTRDGQTWQTMHSVVYGENGMEHLWTQENWAKDYVCSGVGGDKFIVKLTNDDGEITADKTFDEIAAAHEGGKTVELWMPSSSDVDIEDSHDVLNLFEYHNSEEAKSIIFSNAYSEAVLQIFVVSENGTDTWDIAMATIPTDAEKSAWNGKQDALIAGTGINIAADGKTISATAQDVLEVIYTKGAFDPQTLTYEYSCNKTLSAIIAAISGGKIHVRHYETTNNVMPVYTELTCSYNDVSGILAIFSGIDRENNLITVTHSKPTPISSESITVTRTALASADDLTDYRTAAAQDVIDAGKEATSNRLATVNPSADSIATGKYYSASAVSAFIDKLIPHYVSAHSWSVGDYCTFSGTIYKCNTAHSDVQWTSAYWDAVPDFGKDIVDNYALKDDLDEYVAISQGVAHAGKFLVVGDDGNVTTQSIEFLEGGDY